MNRINLLQTRRADLLQAGKEIRQKISALSDENSFVEFDAYAFSENEFYGENAQGEGVVTGFLTIDENPFYVVAQNAAVCNGGISKANCNKITKCLKKAELNSTPVLFLLDSCGVRAGEGVNALEGIAEVLGAMSDLKGVATTYAVVLGNLYGSFALVAAECDFNLMLKDSCVCYTSPAVISASDKKFEDRDAVGGLKAQANNNMTTFAVKDLDEAKNLIVKLCDYIALPEEDNEDDLGRESANLNDKADVESLVKAVFDNGEFTEMNKGFADEVKTGLARIGGTSVAAVLFDGGDKGVELTLNTVLKLKEFLYFAIDYDMPTVLFVNSLGIKADKETNDSLVMKETVHLIDALKNANLLRISVVYGKAIGLGYTLFASKSLGSDYTYAFANAYIGLFDSKVGASVEFEGVKESNLAQLADKYAEENQDPVNAAKDGYVDNIIEPRHVRQYVISALQSL